MAADIKGTAVYWSMGGITFTAGIVSGSNPSMPQSLRFGRSSENTKIKDNNGDLKTIVYHGPMKTLSITVIPSSTSIAGAVASAEAHMIAPGTKVTVADASTSASDTGQIVETNWILVSATQNRTVDGVVTIDLELENATQADLSTSAA
jgi:hypothetical protein